MRDMPETTRTSSLSHHAINQELVRSLMFLSVAFASACTNLLYVAALTSLTALPFWFDALSSTEVSMIVNFVLNDRFTFRNLRSNRPWYMRLARFQVAAIGGNLLTAGISTVLHDAAALTPLAAQIVAISITFFVNFLTHRFWTFASSGSRKQGAQRSLGAAASDSPNWLRAHVAGISVVMPARNEAATVQPLLLRLHHAMMGLGVPYEALLVDDHSTDGTTTAADEVIGAHCLPARVLSLQEKGGKSSALMKGFREARYPVLAMIDSDLELPPETLPAMASELARYDVVVGRRLNYGANNTLRNQLSVVFNQFVMRCFLGINLEVQTGVKIFWKHVYDSIELTPGPWGFDMEFVAKALAKGHSVGEFETPFQKRQIGTTKVNPVAVATELLVAALRIKIAILRAAKANASLKERAESPAEPVPLFAGMRSRLPNVLEWAVPLALLYVFLHVVMGPAFFSSTRFFGTAGDTDQYMWFIGWIWWAIQHGVSPLVTDAFNYPAPIHIMDYTSVPALGLLFGWLYSFVGVILIYNLIIVINYALIFVFGKLTLCALGVGRLLSGAGGLLFCLLPYITAENWQHLNLAFVAPLFIVGYLIVRTIRAERRPGWTTGLLTGLALALAFYTFLETFLTLALCIAVVYACGLLCARAATYRLSVRLMNPRYVLGVAASLLLTVPGLLNFLEGQGVQPVDVGYLDPFFSTDLLSTVIPTQLLLLHNSTTASLSRHFAGNPAGWDGYLAIPFIVLVIVISARHWKNATIRILAHAALVMLLLSFGPFPYFDGVRALVPLPWLFVVLFHVPFLHNALPDRLDLYAQYLALMLVILGMDASQKQAWARAQRHTYHIRIGINIAALALVLLFWMPLVPYPSTLMPQAANILRANRVGLRYIQYEPTLVLHEQDVGFNVVMGILADSNNYELTTSNVYGYAMADTASFKVNMAFVHDTDGAQTTMALRHYLPQLGVGRVMFISIDNRPINPVRLSEISDYLGAPLYNEQGLVVVWRTPQGAVNAAPKTRFC